MKKCLIFSCVISFMWLVKASESNKRAPTRLKRAYTVPGKGAVTPRLPSEGEESKEFPTLDEVKKSLNPQLLSAVQLLTISTESLPDSGNGSVVSSPLKAFTRKQPSSSELLLSSSESLGSHSSSPSSRPNSPAKGSLHLLKLSRSFTQLEPQSAPATSSQKFDFPPASEGKSKE